MATEMKESGIEWIGKIPKSWSIGRIGQLYTERKQKVSDTEYPPLSVTMKGILPQLSSAAKTDAHDDRKLVRKGDFAINSRSDRRGACGISPFDGSVSLINTILMPRAEMHPVYYEWLFHSTMFSDEFYKWGHGIVNDLWTTSWQDMKRIAVPIPSYREQARIAAFLGKICANINTAIVQTQTTIDEYKKLKQAIITQAVTKGIRPNREMKHSGHEWLGAIPDDWEVKKVKYSSDSFFKGSGITKDDIVEGGRTPCVRYGEIYTKYNHAFNNCLSYTELERIASPQRFSNGDILFACTGELVEEIGKSIVYLGEEECLAGGDIIIMKHSQNPAFMNYVLNCSYSQAQKSCGKTKLKVVHISASEIKNVLIAVPSHEEQKEIVEYLDYECARIDKLIEKKERIIAGLKPLKEAFIYEYVTGKKEVSA